MEHIGFIGLGIMGLPMARHLLEAGYPLSVLNRSKGREQELVAAGAVAGESPAAVAASSDVVITMLPDSPDVEQVVFGKKGVLDALRPGSLFIDMSTILPSTAQRIAASMRDKGCEALDAPVSGGQVGAENATLSIMVGGSDEAFARGKPLFERMGKNIVHIGPAGTGQVAKAANQVAVSVTLAAVSEALLLAAKAGADPAKVREALLGGFASSRILEVHGNRMLKRDFKPGFKVKLHRKDLGIVLDTARELNLSLPATAVVAELENVLMAQGGGELDYSAYVTVLEKLAGFDIA